MDPYSSRFGIYESPHAPSEDAFSLTGMAVSIATDPLTGFYIGHNMTRANSLFLGPYRGLRREGLVHLAGKAAGLGEGFDDFKKAVLDDKAYGRAFTDRRREAVLRSHLAKAGVADAAGVARQARTDLRSNVRTMSRFGKSAASAGVRAGMRLGLDPRSAAPMLMKVGRAAKAAMGAAFVFQTGGMLVESAATRMKENALTGQALRDSEMLNPHGHLVQTQEAYTQRMESLSAMRNLPGFMQRMGNESRMHHS